MVYIFIYATKTMCISFVFVFFGFEGEKHLLLYL